jgi:alpha-mannosidase
MLELLALRPERKRKIPMKLRSALLVAAAAVVSSTLIASAKDTALKDTPVKDTALKDTGPVGSAKDPTLYVVGYAHLDTQWRWSYPQVIAEFLKHTMEDNFKLFEKYPHYTFNFTGANRYGIMKEYYPEDFQKLKEYVKAGRWFPAGSSMEEGDVNMPDGEALIRNILYGNQFFRREFGVASDEFMLPDCFGFQATLPSILAHCGIKGFSTQKLTWGSAVGIPFNVGVWIGPDGSRMVSALNCGAYDAKINDDLSTDKNWNNRVNNDGKKTGVYVDYRYYGSGDRGGSPDENSVRWVEKAVTGNGPLHVIAGPADQMFNDLTPAQIAALPTYKGDLLLTWHSAGSLTSQAFVKRTNRKLEELGDAAERAAVTADWLGSSPYPRKKLLDAWTLQLGAHFHDTMAGTALPKTYEYTWNNMVLALNQFAAVAQDSIGGVVQSMDTRAQGIPLVVYNPLSVEREDVAEATIPDAPESMAIFSPDGKEMPFQIVSKDAEGTKVLFLAQVPSVSFSVFSVRASATPAPATELKVTDHTLENARFKVTLNEAGDIASILDKQNHKEILSAPARLEFLYENPQQFPAWNMDWADRSKAPLGYVDGPCTFKIIENGPARIAIQTTRHARGSTVTQDIRLAAGKAGDRVEVANHIDWQTRECSLEAVFPMTVSNPNATYESQSAAVQRANNNEKKYEVPQQQWLDLTSSDESYGVGILNDCKYGSDKPDDNTVRLTLLYTPGVQGGYQDQATQDIGKNEFVYAIAPHTRSWQQAGVPWEAQRLNQPLLTFTTAPHEGTLGKSISIAKVNKPNVSIMAMKKAEESDEVIVRLRETNGESTSGTAVSFMTPILSAREVDGQERPIGPATLNDGKLVTEMKPFKLRAFAVKLAPPATVAAAPVSQPVELAYDQSVISQHANLSEASFDSDGHSYAAEALPPKISSEGIVFKLGPTEAGSKNALECKGQTIQLPSGFDHVYLLAAADGDAPATFKIGDTQVQRTIQDWTGYVGQWDNRIWKGVVPELTYGFANKLAGLAPGFIKRDTIAWFSSHRHDPVKGNEFYKFTYMFKYGFAIPAGTTSITLPDNPKIRVFAMSVGKDSHDNVTPAMPLYDTLKDHQFGSPTIAPSGGTFHETVSCTIDHSLYGKAGDVHYTIDGSEPRADSPVFSSPVFLSSSATVRARQFEKGEPVGPEAVEKFDINDTTPPTVVSASGTSLIPSASVVFSKPVQKASAEIAANYKIEPAIEVTGAALQDDGRTVVLSLAKPVPAKEGARITVSGVQDSSPNANKVSPTATPLGVVGPVVSIEKFEADGNNTKEVKSPELSGKGNSPWTISFYVRTDAQPEDRTIIAGFGTNEDKNDGAGRFLCKFQDGVEFWARNRDVMGELLQLNKWQMLTATYDGKVLRLYKNDKLENEMAVELTDDKPTVRLAPTDAWDHSRRFKGEIRNFTIWQSALAPTEIKAMAAEMPQ